ncbi:MAG TPA: hypothetical protein DCL21_07405 [Alphaproteobacteria bacterium]|nr:hypothetical protein [Alphaproteobacteria bacterium]
MHIVKCLFIIMTWVAIYINVSLKTTHNLAESSSANLADMLGLGALLLLIFIGYLDVKNKLDRIKFNSICIVIVGLMGFSLYLVCFIEGISVISSAILGSAGFLGLAVLYMREIVSEEEKEAY